MVKCKKCKKKEGKNCVYYFNNESYLCKGCYKEWLPIHRGLSKEPGIHSWTMEREYLKWIKEK